ncbi:MAG: hypothetical protein RL748_178 [Pseudomonadota bacterium]|jgi:signal transduction histidine kinase
MKIVFPHPLWLMVCMIVLCLTCQRTQAHVDLKLEAQGQDELNLNPYLAVLEDREQNLTLPQIQQEGLAANFVSHLASQEVLNFGYTRSAYWLRLKLRNNSDQAVERLLEISYALISHIDFYQTDGDKVVRMVRTGNAHPFASRAYPHAQFVFPVVLPPHSNHTVYLRLQSINTMMVPAKLWQVEHFELAQRNNYLLQTGYFGMGCAIILFNLLLAVLLRDTIYLRYVLYLVAMILGSAAEKGLAEQYLWPQATVWQEISSDFFGTMTLGSMLLFMRAMLDTPRLMPRLDRLFQLIAAIFVLVLAGLVLAFGAFVEISNQLVQLTLLLILGTGVYCAIKRYRHSAYFFLAFGQWSLCAFITAFMYSGFLPSNALTVNIMQMGAALEMLLLAFALSNRFERIAEERDQAQRAALQAQQSLLENLQSSERLLEQRVAERSKELALSNQALALANHELIEACNANEAARVAAEQAHQQTTTAMEQLHAAEKRLVQSEKMAVLGHLISGIGKQLYAPIRTIKSSGKQIEQALRQTIEQNLPHLLQNLQQHSLHLFLRLISPHEMARHAPESTTMRHLLQQLKQLGLQHARRDTQTLIELNAQAHLTQYLPLLQHPDAEDIMQSAAQVGSIIHGTEKINAAVNQVSKIVMALKTFSRFDPEGEPGPLYLEDGIEIVLTLHQNRFKHGIQLQRRFQRLPALLCLAGELNQVWNNLIQNALDAMPEQGLLVISIERSGDYALVTICDSGCGIDAANLDHIFDPFFTTHAQSNGLGLSITKRIIEKHHGKIKVESLLGQGTTVRVYLPMS